MSYRPDLLIRPGEPFTGKRLLDIFKRWGGSAPTTQRGPLLAGLERKTVGSQSVIADQRRPIIPRLHTFEGKITANTPAPAGSGRWSYTFAEVRPTGAGEGYETVPSGTTGTAYNRAELNNTSDTTGIQGYGIDLTSTSNADLALIAIRNNSVVEISIRKTAAGGTVYWFDVENPITVTCL